MAARDIRGSGRRRVAVVALLLVLPLAAAEPAGAQTPTPTPTIQPSPTATPEVTPSPDPSPTASPSPDPSPDPDPVTAHVSARLGHVVLFGRAVVSGRVTPTTIDVRPIVRLRRNGHVVAERRASLRTDGRFTLRLRIARPGNYRATVIVSGPGIARAAAGTASHAPALPSLSLGSRGGDVKRLERRLKDLGYYIPTVDRRLGVETTDALIAFNKVQGSSRVGYATANTWRALVSPKRPKPKVKDAWHFEIDQTRQVVFVVKKSKVRWIIHTSTGAGGATHDGVFTVHSKLAGYSANGLYYPSYWDGLRAFHGWPEVPVYAASHGCSRLPMWAAQWMYGLAQIGDTVRVYH